MAITIVSTPKKYTPAFNPVVFSISSSNYAQPSFKFVAEVYDGSGGLIGTLKYQPNPIGTEPIFIDVGTVLHELVTGNYLQLNSVMGGAIVATSGAAISDYSVQFGEQYNDTLYANLTSYSGYVFNGGINNLRFAFYQDTTYLNKKFLSRFSRQTVRKRDSAMVSILQSDTTAITGFGLTVYNSVGVSIYSATIDNPLTSLSADNHRLLHLHVGFDHLNDVLSFGSTVYNTASYYTITPPSGTTYRVDLYSQCERFPGIRLHFLNELGGFDAFNFMLVDKWTQTSESRSYQRQPVNRSTGYDTATRKFEAVTRNYYTRYTEKVKVVSDFLTDQEAEQLADLMRSSIVYMEADAAKYGGTGMVLIPVKLTVTDYEIKNTQVDKLFNFELDMELSTGNPGQGV